MNIRETTKFRKDLRQIRKRGKDVAKLKRAVMLILSEDELPESMKDHPLRGKWAGRRDCHIEPDWVLIYHKTADGLRLERTGSHSDLF